MNNLITKETICLNLTSETKMTLLQEMSNLLFDAGKINNRELFMDDLLKREKEGGTGFEDGIAIPHARSAAVLQPTIAVGIHRNGIDYGSEDGGLTHFIFMIASPENGSDEHIEVLASLSSCLIKPGFTESLLKAKSEEEVVNIIIADETRSSSEKPVDAGLLIGVTGCPTGIAHTYMAAEALEKVASALGYNIIVETNGAVGARNSPTRQDIEKAEAVIIASDKQVETERFRGKRVLFTGVKAPIKSGEKVIKDALESPIWSPAEDRINSAQSGMTANTAHGLYRYLMNGVSYMIPFVLTGGLMIALSLTLGGVPGASGMVIPKDSIWHIILQIGTVAFQLMIPVLSAYIAFAIGERPALAPGFIGGWIANTGSFYGAAVGAGFIGAILSGLIVGWTVKWMLRLPWHKLIQPLVSILIVPLTVTLFIAFLFIFVIGSPIASGMVAMNHLLMSLSGGSLILLGIILGGMAGFDMGGPMNKVAALFCIGMISSGHNEYMGAISCAFPVAPLGMGLATFVSRKFKIFSTEDNEAGKAAFAMGLMGISEGAIPFAAKDPLVVIPANMIGSMVAAVLGFMWGVQNPVAHGGPVVVLLGAFNKPWFALSAMFVGAIVTAAIAIVAKRYKSRNSTATSVSNLSAIS